MVRNWLVRRHKIFIGNGLKLLDLATMNFSRGLSLKEVKISTRKVLSNDWITIRYPIPISTGHEQVSTAIMIISYNLQCSWSGCSPYRLVFDYRLNLPITHWLCQPFIWKNIIKTKFPFFLKMVNSNFCSVMAETRRQNLAYDASPLFLNSFRYLMFIFVFCKTPISCRIYVEPSMLSSCEIHEHDLTINI